MSGVPSYITDVAAFAHLFRRAKEAGLASLPHAGEWAGPANVWATLEHYAPDRIGHGITSIEDPVLVRELADRRIPLEISPVSNVATGAVASPSRASRCVRPSARPAASASRSIP